MTDEILLWPNGAPGSENATHVERSLALPDGERRVVNVTVPTLTPFLPAGEPRTATAVIVAPGGGYRMLSLDSEGAWVAEWLRDRGVAAYVLKYRLLDTGVTDDDLQRSFRELATGGMPTEAASLTPDVLRRQARADAEQAVKHVRATGARTVGFIGFSAGGMVTTDVATSEVVAARPDFVAPIYGASKVEPPADAPPFFCMVCADDSLTIDWCIDAFRAWRQAGRPAELHVYEKGGHGFGLKKLGLPVDGWVDRFGEWMAANGWIGG